MDNSTRDEESPESLAAQPIGYWTGLADKALISFIRREMAAAHGLTQPQYWVLRYLSVNDVSPDGAGRTVAELAEAMREFLRPGDDLTAASAALLARDWVREDPADRRLWLTEQGEAARLRVKAWAPTLRARMHEGIDDADYATTVRTLRRMIRNVTAEG